jgi:hypothetical protein
MEIGTCIYYKRIETAICRIFPHMSCQARQYWTENVYNLKDVILSFAAVWRDQKERMLPPLNLKVFWQNVREWVIL